MASDAGISSLAAAAAVGIAAIVIVAVVVEVYTVEGVRGGALFRRGGLSITPGKSAGEGEERSVRRRFSLYRRGMGKQAERERQNNGRNGLYLLPHNKVPKARNN